jgi:hypothetical protein
MSEHATHVRRAINAIVYAPIGAGLTVVEAAPEFLEACAERGRSEVAHRQQQITKRVQHARGMGQFALWYGFPKLRDRARRRLAEVGSTAVQRLPAPRLRVRPEPATPAPAPEPRSWVPEPAPFTAAASTSTGNGSGAETPASGELPIPGYDALSASQVVERLIGLAEPELDAVRSYESSHRNRRTILGKIEQLASPSA